MGYRRARICHLLKQGPFGKKGLHSKSKPQAAKDSELRPVARRAKARKPGGGGLGGGLVSSGDCAVPPLWLPSGGSQVA